MAHPVAVPVDSLIHPELADAYFHDAFASLLPNGDQSVLDIYLGTVARTPAWVDVLMTWRNRIVACFGLKDLGRMSALAVKKKASDYQVGDRIGIFSILALSERELILGDADKHLTAKISFYKHDGAHPSVTVSTVVHVHNFLGRAYLFFVVPVHKLIVPAMLARIASPGKAG